MLREIEISRDAQPALCIPLICSRSMHTRQVHVIATVQIDGYTHFPQSHSVYRTAKTAANVKKFNTKLANSVLLRVSPSVVYIYPVSQNYRPSSACRSPNDFTSIEITFSIKITRVYHQSHHRTPLMLTLTVGIAIVATITLHPLPLSFNHLSPDLPLAGVE